MLELKYLKFGFFISKSFFVDFPHIKIVFKIFIYFIFKGRIMRIFCKETLIKKVLGLLASCLLFAGCSSEADGGGNTPVTPPASDSALTGVSITGSSGIEADGQTELTASPSTTGTVTGVTYSWQITSGSEYASLSSATGNKVYLSGNNEDTASGHDVTVKVTATWNGTSKESTHTVTVAKKGEVIVDSLESLTLTAGSSSASASDTVSLTAKAGYYGNPSISYTWALTSGGSYASLAKTSDSRAAISYDEKTNTLTVNNTTAASQTITVKVTATYGSTTKEATVNISVAAKEQEPPAGGATGGGSTGYFWKADDYNDGATASSIAANIDLGNSVKTVDAGITIRASAVTVDGITFNNYVYFSGGGSSTSKAISLELPAGATITAYFNATSGRTLKISIGGTAYDLGTTTGTAKSSSYKYEGATPVTAYVYSGGSGINLYGLKVSVDGSATPGGGTTPSVTSVTLSKTTLSLTAGGSETITATVNGTNLTDTSVTWSTDASGIATVSNGTITAVAAGTATITAASKADSSKKAACTVTVTAAGETPASYDIDVVPGAKVTTYGWADCDGGMSYPNTTNIIVIDDKTYPVAKNKRTAFTNAIASGSVSNSSVSPTAAIIVVSGTIDLSDGLISESDKTAYDEFNSDGSRKHGDIVYDIGSNKAIIGVNSARLAYGGLRIKSNDSSNSKSGKNVIIRNIDFWDAHGSTEINTAKDSSSKASVDNLVIEGGDENKNAGTAETSKKTLFSYGNIPERIWIDHCKFSDGTCKDLERNYNHDGSFDMKAGHYVTVSYCEFTNHDKVTLFAPNDNHAIPEQRQITLHHNYYHGAVQRMPRSRGCQAHIYNNVYDEIGTSGNNGYSLGPGTGSMYIVENNYFGNFANSKSLVQYADATTSATSPYCSKFYQSGNNITISSSQVKFDSAEQLKDFSKHLTSTKPWTPAYDYSNMQSNAEAYSTVPKAAGTDKTNYSKTVRVNNKAY